MRLLLLASVAISMAGCSHAGGEALPITAGAARTVAGPALNGLRVSGNKLVDRSNNVVHLRGVQPIRNRIRLRPRLGHLRWTQQCRVD